MKEYLKQPRIDGKTDREQIGQIKNYLYQTVLQLNFILSTLENGKTVQQAGISDQERAELLNKVRNMIREAIAGTQTGGTT